MFQQPDAGHAAGYLLPFHLDTRATSAANIPSTSHAWQVQHDAWNGGRMDGWMAAHRGADGVHAPYVMGYHTRADLPVQFALAEAFTVCDAWHASVLGPTWPNRMMWMTGTVDAEGRGGGPCLDNAAPRGGLPLDHLRRAAHAGGRELAGLPAGRHVRLQRAGAVRRVPPVAPGIGAGGRRPRRPLGVRVRERRA